MEIRRIEPTGELYQAERELRNRVLLRPIGLPDHAWEQKDADSLHFIAIHDDQVVGCVLLWPDSQEPPGAQLLQMAVDEACQGQGVGRLMIQELVRAARELGLSRIWCHARMKVAPFYTRLGFEPQGEVFEEVGLEHQVMVLGL